MSYLEKELANTPLSELGAKSYYKAKVVLYKNPGLFGIFISQRSASEALEEFCKKAYEEAIDKGMPNGKIEAFVDAYIEEHFSQICERGHELTAEEGGKHLPEKKDAVELIELQKRNRNDLSLEGDTIVYELISGHYLQVQHLDMGNPRWCRKDQYTPERGDKIMRDYPNGVDVVGVGPFESREHFLEVMERNFAVEVVSSVSE